MPRRRRRAAGEVTGYGRAVTARKRTRGMRETLGDPDDGRVEFRTDESGGVTVVVDGHPQSYVDPHDPGLLTFEYVQHLATCLDALDPPAPQRLTITHLGGAAMTLARYVEHTRPGSPQLVLEPDARLTERVRAHLPLPRGHRIRVRPTDGRAGMAALATDSADVVVLDAFDRGTVPPDLTTLEALAECARVLRPRGVARQPRRRADAPLCGQGRRHRSCGRSAPPAARRHPRRAQGTPLRQHRAVRIGPDPARRRDRASAGPIAVPQRRARRPAPEPRRPALHRRRPRGLADAARSGPLAGALTPAASPGATPEAGSQHAGGRLPGASRAALPPPGSSSARPQE